MKKKKLIGLVLIIMGVSTIVIALGIRYYGIYNQKKMLKDFEKTIEDVDKKINDKPQGETNSDSKADTVKQGAIGIMIIPKIDLKVAIGEGIDMEILKYAVGHFKETAMPGKVGNFCVAGHRSYTYNEYFNRLDELKEGDEIIVKTKDAEFKYKIYEKKVVEPTEISVLEETKEAEITLVTCTPIRVATHRLIIKGKLQ